MTERPLAEDEIAAVCCAAVAALPDGRPVPLGHLASVVAGLQEGVEPAPKSRAERLAHVIARHLLREGVDDA